MSATMELDPMVKQALKLLHSPSPDSAEKIRISLDELIKQRYGTRKMLVNTLNKKYLEEESSSPGTSVKRRKSNESRGSSTHKNSSPPVQQEPMAVDPVGISIGDVSEEENLKEFGDLACVVCGAMVLTAGNRLVECADCHSLYHQECHKPPISEDDANEQEFSWCCTDCKNKVMMAKSATSISIPSPSKSSSSSSSSSYTPTLYPKTYEPSSTTSSKSKSSSTKVSSSSSKSSSSYSNHVSSSTTSASSAAVTTPSSSNSKSASSSSASSSVTPSINIISADQRLQIMKKKAAKQLESKRKHK